MQPQRIRGNFSTSYPSKTLLHHLYLSRSAFPILRNPTLRTIIHGEIQAIPFNTNWIFELPGSLHLFCSTDMMIHELSVIIIISSSLSFLKPILENGFFFGTSSPFNSRLPFVSVLRHQSRRPSSSFHTPRNIIIIIIWGYHFHPLTLFSGNFVYIFVKQGKPREPPPRSKRDRRWRGTPLQYN